MSVIADMIDFLSDGTALNDKVDGKFHSLFVPDGSAYPFVVLRMVTESPSYSQDGEGRMENILQIEAYSDSVSEAYEVAGLIHKRLSGYSGSIGSRTGYILKREAQDQWMSDARHFRVFGQYIVRS